MDLGPTDQDAVLRAEWLEAVVAISQMLANQALTNAPVLVHTLAVFLPRGRWKAWVGDLAPGIQLCQSTSCLYASGGQGSDLIAPNALAFA